ncbi:hypothetical protein INR49_015170 [Caranx melampygus]|nr:hypothetical protein INR49_015170 [Caranx melampygus]
MDAHLLKKMAFRKSLSPGGLVSGGLGVGKLVLRTGPSRLGDASTRACPEPRGQRCYSMEAKGTQTGIKYCCFIFVCVSGM